ncbi:MAG: MBL fold metallo-hydrolase [Christensenellales bacterium]
MQIEAFLTSVIGTNTYLVYEGDKGFIVDPGDDGDGLYLEGVRRNVKIEAVLLTHGHFDHINGASFLQSKGAKVYCHRLDEDKLNSYRSMASLAGVKLNPVKADVLLDGGETLDICGIEVKTIWTPGHSKGGICYIAGDVLFSGDTLMNGSYGRYDFYDGNFVELKDSIVNKLFALSGDYKVFPGHGEATTLSEERNINPINFE